MSISFGKHAIDPGAHATGAMERRLLRLQNNGRIFTTILFGFIMFFLFVSILMGIQTYRSINNTHSLSNETLIGVSLITNNISFNDSINAVSVGKGPEGRALVLTENLNGASYETRFYSYQGNVVQEYTISENPYIPQTAQIIVASSRFDFTFEDNLITIMLDQGTSHVAIRSYQGDPR